METFKLIGKILDGRLLVGYRCVSNQTNQQKLITIDEAVMLADQKRLEGVKPKADRNGLLGVTIALNSLKSEQKNPDRNKKPTVQSSRSIEDRYERIIGAAADDGTLQGVLQGCRNMVLLSKPDTLVRKKCDRFDAVEQVNLESRVSGITYTFVICKMDGCDRPRLIGEEWILKLISEYNGELTTLDQVTIRQHNPRVNNDCRMDMEERIQVMKDLYPLAKKYLQEIVAKEAQESKLA